MKSLILRIFSLGFIVATLSQCSSTIKVTEADKNQLDPNFAGYSGVLLIIRNYDNKHGYNNVDKTVIKAFKKYYKGEFEMISGTILSTYKDLDKYRFVVESGFGSDGVYQGKNLAGNMSYDTKSWYVLKDRKTGKETKTQRYGDYYGLEYLPIAFEAARASK